jgi:two-component system, NarL family, response regulator NreC
MTDQPADRADAPEWFRARRVPFPENYASMAQRIAAVPLINTVLIVEDHPIFLKGLHQLLSNETGFSIVSEASNCRDAMASVVAQRPSILLVDLTLGDENGLDLIKDASTLAPEMRILVLSMHDERFYAERALAAGAHGYCMKGEAADHMMDALRTVASGKTWLSPRLRERSEEYHGEFGQYPSVRRLSDREFQIFELIGKGLGTVEMAAKLNLSAKTIDTHKENIKLKLHCATSQDLRQYAIEWQTTQGRA